MKKRNFKPVDISGIDISAPDIHAKDGACESIVNMRYRAGAWSNMCRWSSSSILAEDSLYKIIYRHPSLVEGDYIARYGDTIHHIRVTEDGTATSIATLLTLEDNEEVKLSHFGTILYITRADGTDNIFVWYNNCYTPFDLEGLPPIDDATITPTFISADADDDDNSCGLTLVAEVECDDDGVALESSRFDNHHYGEMRSSGFIPGMSHLMIGYRLFDGSIVKCGRVDMLQSQKESEREEDSLLLRIFDNTYRYYTRLTAAKHRVFFTVPSEVRDSPLITSIVLLATRPVEIYNLDKVHDNFSIDEATSLGGRRYMASRSCIISDEAKSSIYSPYYIVEKIETSGLGGSYSITLEYDKHFESLHFNDTYEPNFSIHTMRSAVKLDYNNRLHCGNIREILYDGAPLLYDQPTITIGSNTYSRMAITRHNLAIETKVATSDREITVRCLISSNVIYSCNDEQYIIVPNLLAYPDSRATEMTIYYQYDGSSSYYKLYNTTLESAPSVNMAWSADFEQNSVMFHRAIKLTTTVPFTPSSTPRELHSADKVVVSESGNPFVFLPSHTYYLGTGTEITRLTTSSQQLTESRYGQHPLIAFTSSGIYAFEQGSSDILYLNSVLISRDIIKSGSDVLSIEPYIFYFNDRDVMAVRGSNTFSISTQITPAASNSSAIDITQYLDGAYMLYSSLYGELYVFNKRYTEGFCYNIEDKRWSKRTMSGDKINDSMIVTDGKTYDLGKNEDSSSPLPCSLSTMAIKIVMGSYKHLDAVLGALDADPSTLWSYTIYGSNDLAVWYPLRTSTMNRHMRRFASSWRYFKIKVDVTGYVPESGVGNYFTISGFDFEYYSRFDSHLRGDR